MWPATTYTVDIRVESVAGWGAWSDPILVDTLTTFPDPPGQPVAQGTTCFTITLIWEAPPRDNGHHLTHYHIQIQNINSGNTEEYGIWKTVSASVLGQVFVCRSLHPDTPYLLRCRACTSDGYGDWSEISNVIRTNPELNAPKVEAKRVHLSW